MSTRQHSSNEYTKGDFTMQETKRQTAQQPTPLPHKPTHAFDVHIDPFDVHSTPEPSFLDTSTQLEEENANHTASARWAQRRLTRPYAAVYISGLEPGMHLPHRHRSTVIRKWMAGRGSGNYEKRFKMQNAQGREKAEDRSG